MGIPNQQDDSPLRSERPNFIPFFALTHHVPSSSVGQNLVLSHCKELGKCSLTAFPERRKNRFDDYLGSLCHRCNSSIPFVWCMKQELYLVQ